VDFLLSTGSVHHLDPETAFWVAHYARFDGVELLIDSRMVEVGAAGIARFAKQYQMPVRHIHAPLTPVAEWRGHWECVRRSLAWARGLGARLLVLHPDPSIRGLWRRRRIFARRLIRLHEAAAEHDITVALENLPRSANPVQQFRQGLGRFESVVSLAREGGVRMTFDTTHLGTWGTALVPAFRRAHGLVANLHLSDYAAGRQHLLPKHGTLPLADLLTTAHQVGYTGPIVLEVCPAALQHGPPDAVLPPLIRARKWLKRHAGR